MTGFSEQSTHNPESKTNRAMDYIPNTDAGLDAMMREAGFATFDEMTATIPNKLKDFKLELPRPLTELELWNELRSLAACNLGVDDVLSFLGGGAYEHYIPAAIDTLTSRSEFYTAYTPYQAEASQGTLQAIYEYQSMICALTGMDVSNASLYDGGSGLAEAVYLALNAQTGKRRVVLSGAVHPEYREVIRTYTRGLDCELVELTPCHGVMDMKTLQEALQVPTAAVVAQSPNFFGVMESMGEVSRLAHEAGALLIASVNPISLGLIQPPGAYGADICVGEGQPLGIPLSYGGPYLGFLAAKKALVHKISGRIVGRSTDVNGTTGFCLTLQAREQHIRRERATSNICSNQALMALRACIYLSLLGKRGLEEVARLNWQKAHYFQKAWCQLDGCRLVYEQPFFNEFVMELPETASALLAQLEDQGIYAGIDLARFGMSANQLLVCVTETKSRVDIDRSLKAIKQALDRLKGRASRADR